MGYWNIGSLLHSLFDAIIRPSRFVAAETTVYSTTVYTRTYQFFRLVVVYLLNLLMYAIPLSLAGVGVPETIQAPQPIIAVMGGVGMNPEPVWRLMIATALNSAYITAAAGVTFVSYHIGAVLTFGSSGITQSLHTIVYSTSAYLAGLFTTVWYLSTHGTVGAVREFVLAVQKAFVYWVIDLIGAEAGMPGGRPDSITATGFSDQGLYLMALIVVLLGYYIYSLYLGARINHEMSRTTSIVAILFVSVSPVLYVAGSVMASAVGII